MKAKTIFKVNSKYLIQALLERGITATEAAHKTGLSADLLCKCLRSDRYISLRTAGKLQAEFGSEVLIIEKRGD